MVEVLISVLVATVLMLAIYNAATASYRAGTRNEGQVLAINMAQEIIDNARNSSWNHLTVDLLGETAGVPSSTTSSQVLSLYSYPSGNLQNAFFPRPLLANHDVASGFTYTNATLNQKFNGTVTETLTDLNTTPDDAIEVDVLVKWSDSMGPHTYSTSTRIDQYGVHNY